MQNPSCSCKRNSQPKKLCGEKSGEYKTRRAAAKVVLQATNYKKICGLQGKGV
jgi:hypothetical protein